MNDVTVAASVTEEVAEAQTEAVEAASDAAVEIAQIQAAAAIAITEDNNDTAVELAELENDEDDLLWLRGQLDELRLLLVTQGDRLSLMEQQHQQMLSSLESLTSLLIQTPPLPQAGEEPIAVIVEEPESNASVENTPEETPKPRRKYL